jgi:hypothetical protein
MIEIDPKNLTEFPDEIKFKIIPDPAKHLKISLIKSFIRCLAGIVLILGGALSSDVFIFLAGGGILIAELLGVLEELV